MSQDNDQIRTFVDAVEDYWSRHGMSSPDRRRLCAELEQDLEEAVRGNVTSADVLRDDPAHFAQALAAANGIELNQPRAMTTPALIRHGLTGGFIAAALAWTFVYRDPTYLLVSGLPELWGALAIHLLAATVTLGGIALGMWWPFKHEPGAIPTAIRATLLTALAGALSVAPIMLIAAASDYSNSPLVLLIEIGIAAAFCATAITAATKFRDPSVSEY